MIGDPKVTPDCIFNEFSPFEDEARPGRVVIHRGCSPCPNQSGQI